MDIRDNVVKMLEADPNNRLLFIGRKNDGTDQGKTVFDDLGSLNRYAQSVYYLDSEIEEKTMQYIKCDFNNEHDREKVISSINEQGHHIVCIILDPSVYKFVNKPIEFVVWLHNLLSIDGYLITDVLQGMYTIIPCKIKPCKPGFVVNMDTLQVHPMLPPLMATKISGYQHQQCVIRRLKSHELLFNHIFGDKNVQQRDIQGHIFFDYRENGEEIHYFICKKSDDDHKTYESIKQYIRNGMEENYNKPLTREENQIASWLRDEDMSSSAIEAMIRTRTVEMGELEEKLEHDPQSDMEKKERMTQLKQQYNDLTKILNVSLSQKYKTYYEDEQPHFGGSSYDFYKKNKQQYIILCSCH
jgi:hypothetical protein